MNIGNATNSEDPFDLRRFIAAQEGVYEQALAELKAGRKRTHWMWYVFPQIDGLGFSPTSKKYAIRSIEEARGYLQHPVLGARLRECAHALLAVGGRSASEIFGDPDEQKLRSCMTLFASASATDPAFVQVLKRYFHGTQDAATMAILEKIG